MAIIAGEKYWILENGASAYALGVTAEGFLVQTHFGPALPRPEDYPSAVLGRQFSMENALQHTHQEVATGEAGASDERTIDAVSATGLRGFALRFEEAKIDGDTLSITLTDTGQGARIILDYAIRARHGLFSRKISIENGGAHALKLIRCFSGTFYLPRRGEYTLHHLDGRWGDEFRMQADPFAHGVISHESRRITSSHGGVPYFAVDSADPARRASEDRGEVWFGALEWSGNWRLLAERTRDGRAIVHLGINDHDFAWDLQPGERFAAPGLIFGHTRSGFGDMSRRYHDFVRQTLSPRPDYLPPVVYNSWYATLFDVNAEGQSALADKAAAIGVELFVIDDGWFDKRVNDRAGLGDWWPDRNKFPNGLKPLADMVHDRGMKFGLWIEPEMVNPDSDLYRAHADWIVHFPERERTLSRNQSLLNMGRVDVQDYLIGIFDRLLSETPIDFIKWDMNRNVSEPGWPGHDRDAREIWVRYVQGLYRVWGELRRRHPDVIWENCSGGGGRVDMGMMALTEQSWASDNTLPPARLQIQEGYSQLFPANTMAAWVTDEHQDEFSLQLRFHAAMAGALGVGGNLLEWSQDQCAEAARHVAFYKEIRPLVAYGDLYRLASPHRAQHSAFAYVAKDKSQAVLFCFRLAQDRIAANPLVFPQGLDPQALYRDEAGEVRTGMAWSERGFAPELGNYQSTIKRLVRLH